MSQLRTSHGNNSPSRGDEGQVTIFVVLALSIFILGFVGFAVDMTNLWFHRQMAQGGADAACQAGIMNVLVPTGTQGFTPGTNFDCKSSPSATPCRYAALNGYNGAGLVAATASNQVSVTFPPAGTVTLPPGAIPPTSLAPVPFLRVDVTDRVRLTFATLISGQPTMDVRAFSICGLALARVPVPLIVLNPTCTHAFQVSGSASLAIVGGPTRSVQVNSSNSTCAAATQSGGCSGNGTIDLSRGGPNFTGSSFGVFGQPTAAPTNFLPGSTGSWLSPATPISDPYALTPPPPVQPPRLAPTTVPYGAFGCPDQTAGCIRYQPGLYTDPIVVKNATAIFDPGIYYIQPTAYTNANNGLSGTYCGSPGTGCVSNPSGQCSADFVVDSNGIVRPSTDPGDGSGGVMFYLSGPGGATGYGSAFFGANAGKAGARIVDPFSTAGITCPGGTAPSPQLNLPGSVPGNVLLGQCTSGGSYFPYQPVGPVRGMLFFQDRFNNDDHGQPSMQGGGGLLLSGTLYFHNCTALPCNPPPTDYQAFFQLQGNPGSGTFLLGNITTDELIEAGNGGVAMQLDPNAVYLILKATLVR